MSKKIKAVYSDKYFAQTSTTSMRKLPLVAKRVELEELAELVEPRTLDIKKLSSIHDSDYVRDFVRGCGPLRSSQGWDWTPQIRDGVLAIQSGQLMAAEIALREGISANIGQGFHHALPEYGGGFCTFNGLALVAREYPKKKICVLDCDEHEGNGTAEFTRRLKNLYNITIFGTEMGGTHGIRSTPIELPNIRGNFKIYEEALNTAYEKIKEFKPDLVIYQAGVDCHENDPCGRICLTTEQLFQRDLSVFNFLKVNKIPSFFVLAGGYQENMERDLVPLHVNTFKAAREVYFNT